MRIPQTSSGGQPGLANLGNLTSKTQAGLKEAAAKLSHNPVSGALAAGGAFLGNDLGNIGKYVAEGDSAHYVDPIQAALKAYQAKATPLADPQADPQHASMLSAFSRTGGAAPTPPASLAGTGGYAPASLGDGLGLPAAPTMNIPGQDYNSYLSQAQNALDLGAIAQPYDQAINQVTNDTGISVGNIGAAAQGAQANIAGGSALLQQVGNQANANNAAVEQALARQSAGANASNGAVTSAAAQALGTGTLQGQINSSAGQQNAAAQQYLAASALDNNNTVNANTATQVADNQNYGRVVDAKATSDQQNAELAGQDAKVGIGMQKGSALLGAREAAAAQAVQMQQNAISNALAQYGAQEQTWKDQVANQFGLAGLGLQEKTFEAGQTAAQAQALQQYLTDREGAMEKILQYGGTNPEVSGQMVQDVSNYGNLSPYLAALGGGAALPLNVNTAKKYNLGGY